MIATTSNDNPKISVIIPIYNVEKFLPRCLDSVLAQSFKDFEVICVNDGTPDNCGSILKQYAKKDPRIKIINQENQGLSMARNNGFKAANGEFIYFLDSDDFIHPRLLEYAYGLAVKHNADLVSFDYVKNKTNKTTYDDKTELSNLSDIDYLLTEEPLNFWRKTGKYRLSFNVWTKFYKKDLIKDFAFVAKIHYEDYPLTCSILSKKPRCIITNLKLYYYTCNPDSISNQKINPKQIKDYHSGINYIYNVYNKPELAKELAFLKKTFIPNILKQQLAKCQKAEKSIQPEMYETFAAELRDLQDKNLISWRGHNIFRYLIYKKLIFKGK